MKLLLVLVVLSVLLTGTTSWLFGKHHVCCGKVGCFSDEFPYNHLPVPKCPAKLRIQLTLFTRTSNKNGVRVTNSNIPEVEIVIECSGFPGSKSSKALSNSKDCLLRYTWTNLAVFRANAKTVFVVHGWACSKKLPWVDAMKGELLKKGDFNVVQVLWYSKKINYAQSAADTRSVGIEVARLAKRLVVKHLISPAQLWCVGHSLGSHVCGHASKRYRFARITALDPAGPLFDADDGGLAKTDAAFVDVIHTNAETLGTYRALGHVDFYPNKGRVQPGCGLRFELFMDYIGGNICSHKRAQALFTESINSPCKFKGIYKCSSPSNVSCTCEKCESNCQTMGYDASPDEVEGVFYLRTNSRKPYCK